MAEIASRKPTRYHAEQIRRRYFVRSLWNSRRPHVTRAIGHASRYGLWNLRFLFVIVIDFIDKNDKNENENENRLDSNLYFYYFRIKNCLVSFFRNVEFYVIDIKKENPIMYVLFLYKNLKFRLGWIKLSKINGKDIPSYIQFSKNQWLIMRS